MEEVLKALAKNYSELPKRSEFTAALQAFSAVIAKALEGVEKRVDARLARIRDGKDGRNGKDGKQGPKGDKGEPGETIIGPQGKTGRDGKDGKDGSPDTADDIRNKLELLNGDDRLKIEAIRDLREELDALKRTNTYHTFAVQRGQLRAYDLSDQLDGVTSTFNLPAFWRIISVQSTSTPVVFRPTIDYTANASVPSITFTTQIDPATTLASGQTLLVIYAEP